MQHTCEVADVFNTPQSENNQGNYNLETPSYIRWDHVQTFIKGIGWNGVGWLL